MPAGRGCGGGRSDDSSNGELSGDESELELDEWRLDGEGRFGRKAVESVLEALVVLGRKPVRWEVRVVHISAQLHLDQLLEAFYRRRLRLVRHRFDTNARARVGAPAGGRGVVGRGGGEASEMRQKLLHEQALTRRLRSKLQHWLILLKRNVRQRA